MLLQSHTQESKMAEYRKQQATLETSQANDISKNKTEESMKTTADAPKSAPKLQESFFEKSNETANIPFITQKPEEQLFKIKNDFIEVTFSNYGGAIKNVEFIGKDPHGKLQYRADLETETPYIFNKYASMPALAISWVAQDEAIDLKAFDPIYQLGTKTDNTIQFILKTSQGMEIRREYIIAKNNDNTDPYIIKHSTRFANPTQTAYDLKKIYLNTGTLPITEGDNYKMHLNFGYFDTVKDDVNFVKVSEFLDKSGIFVSSQAKKFVQIESQNNSISWGAVKNQFFTGVITPEENASGIFVKGFEVDEKDSYGAKKLCMTGNLEFNLGDLAPGTNKDLNVQYFVGPKEYTRLADLGKNQDLVMQFGVPPFHWGPFIFISQKLLVGMKWMHSGLIHVSENWAWGFTIILFTILIKGSLWPLTAIQVKSSKKMQLIQEPMKALKEKFKDNPQKQQQEMMKLFKEHNVNPAAGCIPMLIQIPIFIGLFGMLRTASELRFASFLWVKDLSVADSLSWLPEIPQYIPYFNGPIHILPLLMGISMYYQMKMMPTPTTDNIQIKVIKFMPLIFFLFSWKFPAGLVIYWTTNNLLTILQTRLTKGTSTPAIVQNISDKQSPLISKGRKTIKAHKK
jgi:YidC/Oxa1 family membrane protein insertase